MPKSTEKIPTILSRLPECPGVYQMKDSAEKTIYVGKSVNLKSRVSSYFNGTSSLGPAKKQMVARIADIEIIETRTGTEALVLETNLIKEMRPKYNVLMKDDKDLAYVRISDGPVSAVERIRVRGKGGKYFGPYPSGSGISACLEHLRRLFKIRSCRMAFEYAQDEDASGIPIESSGSLGEMPSDSDRNSRRVRIVSKAGRTPPCMDYYIGICPAPCLLKRETLKEHANNVAKLEKFLQGERSEVIEGLESEMRERAKNLEFEEAQKIKERLAAVRALSEKQIARNSVTDEADAFVILEKNGRNYVGFCRIRDTELRSLSRHSADNPLEETAEGLSVAFLSELYASEDADLPKILFLEREIGDADFMAFLKEKGVRVEFPQIGPKAELLSFLRTNVAGYALRDGMEKITKRAFGRTTMVSILEGIGFEAPKKGEIEFECYDISHTDGHFTVASRVVTTNGKANPAKYRKYKIKTLEDGKIDDFASMREVMYRRVLEGFEAGNFPTMIVIDGGKGQLSSARDGMERAVEEWKSREPESGTAISEADKDGFVRKEGERTGLAPNGVEVAVTSSVLLPSDPGHSETLA
ncbi:MAG: Excinuclease subunit UvrC [Patescibacteria group bacterium]|nr:Excinuclease subunit UvrC [Patescibacteria group bacterium]